MAGSRFVPSLILPLWLGLAAGCQFSVPRGTPEDLLARSRAAYEAENWEEAAEYGYAVTYRHEESDEAAHAYFLTADARRHLRHGDESFTAYKALAEEHPHSVHSVEAASGEYQLGVDYLEGRMPGFLFFSSARGRGVTILEHMQLHNRQHDLADDALVLVAEYYLEHRRFEEAADTLREVLAQYPRSEHTPRARYQLARCLLNLSGGPRYDERTLLESRRAFKDFIGTAEFRGIAEGYPEQIASARESIALIDELLAEKQYLIGRFYERTDQPGAAVHYYDYCLRTYPETKHAERSRERLGRLGEAR